MHGSTERPYCAPETNITLYVISPGTKIMVLKIYFYLKKKKNKQKSFIIKSVFNSEKKVSTLKVLSKLNILHSTVRFKVLKGIDSQICNMSQILLIATQKEVKGCHIGKWNALQAELPLRLAKVFNSFVCVFVFGKLNMNY